MSEDTRLQIGIDGRRLLSRRSLILDPYIKILKVLDGVYNVYVGVHTLKTLLY